jgi:hypothetical protein
VAADRRGRGFERAGAGGVQDLGLPPARTDELRLAVAWNAAAGAEIARRVSGVRLRAGVLEVEVGDPRWAEAIEALLPRLAGGVAARDAALRIRGARVVERVGARLRRGAVHEVDAEWRTAGPIERPEGRPGEGTASRASTDVASRLLRVAERCLVRAGKP